MILAATEEEIDVLARLYPADEFRLDAIIILPLSAYEVFLRYPGTEFEAAMALVVLTYQEIIRIAGNTHVFAILPDFLFEGSSAIFLALALAGIRPISHKLTKHVVCADRYSIDIIATEEPLKVVHRIFGHFPYHQSSLNVLLRGDSKGMIAHDELDGKSADVNDLIAVSLSYLLGRICKTFH